MENGNRKSENLEIGIFRFSIFVVCRLLSIFCLAFFAILSPAHAQSKYENRQITNVDVSFERAGADDSAKEQYRLIARNALGEKYSAVKIRDAIEALYNTGKIVSVSAVQANEDGQAGVNLRFVIRRKTRAEKVNVQIGKTVGESVTEQQLLLKLNLLNPGTAITQQTLDNNVDLILDYLRERGYFNAEVTATQQPIGNNETQVAVTFNVVPNAQATVENFNINIAGFDATKVRQKLELFASEPYSRELLDGDVAKIRKALREEKFLAPELEDARVVYNREKNSVSIELNGKVGAAVNVSVDTGKEKKLGDKTLTKLLSIKREGTLDYAAIIEGARRLRNFYQEKGYFFAEVTPLCAVKPEFTEDEASATANQTEVICGALSGADLTDRVVDVNYKANLNRQLKLVDIRIEGTDKITTADVQSVLKSQKANALGFIPFFGYGRGYTSNEILEDDRLTLQSLLRELGYRRNKVTVRQGVSPTGDNLIITFVVEEGIPTRIAGVELQGNKAFPTDLLRAKLPDIVGKNFSRARARNGVRSLSEFYSQEGFYDAKVSYSLVEIPHAVDATEEAVKVVYNLENEGKKVFINRILINGNDLTKNNAILKAVNLRRGDVLRATDIFASEQNLYATDAFSLVEIKPEPAGETADGKARLSDIIINVEEQKPRLITYGGGYSTDIGANGFFDIRHFNLFGNLQQGGARVRMSRLQQLVQLDYLNPRFMPDGKNRFAPLTVTAQYQRDSTVTRFFRTSFDKGTFGIVQRIDEKGNPIDEFGAKTGSPTINRLTLSAETSRTISRKYRSILFVRYKYEDVRLFNIESLLIRDLLEPDRKVRTSGLGANFVFDTRKNCSIKYTLLEIISKGDPGDPCRYNPGDPTRGNYITAEYSFSLPALGANIGFHKFQGSYNTFYTFPKLKNTTLAGRAVLGLASVFSRNSSFSSAQFPGLEGILPISERFFAGGSTTLRGFDFEGAGPRVVVAPQGTFRNSKGDIVTLNSFTIPFGGNALAITNLEARIPLTKSLRVVPFYDGGNVFRSVGDIFKRSQVAANDVFRQNINARWTNTVGLGFRIKAPVGGEFAIDYGYLLNPPIFIIPQSFSPNAEYRLKQGRLHFRFTQAF
ncbi:MAG: BamA/TamA family outer membrane protein [Acidobacteriota bacterium]|nr:BamA/TamA family outer membrane protein [Acidobacteriota bacterium]